MSSALPADPPLEDQPLADQPSGDQARDQSPDAAGIARRRFATAWRGYDPAEVQAHLRELSHTIERLHRSEADQRQRAEQAERRAELAEKHDEHRLIELLGEETARVLEAARQAASDIRHKAEEGASRLVGEADEEARKRRIEGEADILGQRARMLAEVEELRQEAAGELEKRRAEAAEIVAEMRLEAQTVSDEMRQRAEKDRADAAADAEALRNAGREDARRMVAEAQTFRERTLRDLARRRRAAREQVERLNAARERLLAAYDVVRRTVDEATTELNVALPQAKAAGDTAMRRVHDEPEPTVDELEAQVTMAKMVGLLGDEDADAAGDAAPDAVLPEADAVAEPQPAPPEPEAAPEPEVSREDDLDAVAEPEVSPGDDLEPEAALDTVSEDDLEPEAAPDTVSEDDPQPEAAPEDDLDAGVAEAVVELGFPKQAVASVDSPPEVGGDESDPQIEPVPTDRSSGVDELFARLKANSGAEPLREASPAAENVEANARLLRQRDETLEPLERALARRLKRVLADEQNEVLDLVRRRNSLALGELLPEADAHADRFADAAVDELQAAAYWGAAAANGQPGASSDALADDLGTAMTAPLRERVARLLEETDGDLDELTQRLRALYREWKGQRVGDTVHHYLAAAYARGAFDAVGDDALVCWVVDRSSPGCPDADDNALAGPMRKGEAFPTGHTCPPAHPGCRCMAVPVGLTGTELGREPRVDREPRVERESRADPKPQLGREPQTRSA